MIEVKVGISGGEEISRKLGILASAVDDLSKVFDEVVHPYILNQAKMNFETSGAYSGQAWDFSGEPKYKAFKRHMAETKGVDMRPLWWIPGGREWLRPSLTNPSHGSHIYVSDEKRVIIGTSVPHAAKLNEGGKGPFGEPFPARRPLGMTQGQRKELITLMQRGIMALAESQGKTTRQIRFSL